MDSITLENFINYCDEMQIAEEGFKDNKFFSIIEKGWTMIKNAVKHLFAKISTFLIKVRSKGDKILVNNTFYNKYTNLEINIKHMNDMDSTKKREISARIDELLKESYKSMDGGGNTISISDISNKVNSVKGELDTLNKAADKALAKLKVSKKALDEAISKETENSKKLNNSEIGDFENNFISRHNSIVDRTEKESSYRYAKEELEKANAKLYQSQLYIKLYIGMLNKFVPPTIE